jgi:hypothetical protein
VRDSQYGLPLLDGCGVTSRKRTFAILSIAAFLSLNLGLALACLITGLFDLIRKLLLYFEAKADDRVETCPAIGDHSPLEIKYHLLLMDVAGFLGRTIYVLPMSLTWQGHEFLEAARNDKFWRRAKALVIEKSGALSFELLKAVLVSLAKQALES